jgi:hypothetical protein
MTHCVARCPSFGWLCPAQVGEHWIGSYQCVDNDDPDRLDVRRMDIKAITKFEHEDASADKLTIGQGS